MTETDAINRLNSGDCSLVVLHGGELHVRRQRGVSDLLYLLSEQAHILNNAFIADKIVGKGAAALMILGKVRSVYAGVISHPAKELLDKAGIPCSCRLLVRNIINRSGTGTCPVESICSDCESAEECLPLIIDFVKHECEKVEAN